MTPLDQKPGAETDPMVLPVLPGLIVRQDPPDETGLIRFTLIHEQSGNTVTGPTCSRCALHMGQVIEIIKAQGIDWSQSIDQLVLELRSRDNRMELHKELASIGICFDTWTAKHRPCFGEPGYDPNYLSDDSDLAEGASA